MSKWIKVGSSVFLYLFLEVVSDLVDVGCLGLEGILRAFYL